MAFDSVASAKRHVRISVRAVVAGALVELALIGLVLTLARSLGWSFVSAEQRLGAASVVFGIAAWTAGALAGGYAAAVVSRSVDRRDGIAHGVVTWATALLGAGIASRLWVVLALEVGLVDLDTVRAFATPRTMLALFLAEFLALVAAVVGAIAGSRAERSRELGPRAAEVGVEWRPSDQPQPAP